MSDGADEFFKSGARPARRKPAFPVDQTPANPANAPSDEEAPRPAEPTSPKQPSSMSADKEQEAPVTGDQGNQAQEPPLSSSTRTRTPAERQRAAGDALGKLLGTASDTRSATDPGVEAKHHDAPAEKADPVQPKRRRTQPSDLLSRLRQTDEKSQPARNPLEINPEFQIYLSPETWRRLNSHTPQRRVLITAQERMRSVLFQLSTFLPNNLVQEKIQRPVPGLVTGKMLYGSLLFSDVSGFTALAERLAALGPAGAERLTAIMNDYFAVILDIVAASGGILLKFAGDATLVYFPKMAQSSNRRSSKHALMAARTGLRMLDAMRKFENIEVNAGRINLKMKIGIATGGFLAACIGSAERMEYAVLGTAVNGSLHAESASTAPGQVIADEETAASLDSSITCLPHKGGFFQIALSEGNTLDSFEIKAGAQRSRSGINWSAEPEEILQNMETVLRQIKAIQPFIPAEISSRIISQFSQRRVMGEFRSAVTIFCNFTGPEQLLAAWGDGGLARLTAILSAYFNAMHEVIHRFGGVITRIDPYTHGTKMLILFGAPISHEDDPQRAISAALTMNMELEQVNERLMRKFSRFLPPDFEGNLIQHRMGVTYGEIFATEAGAFTRREYTVMGDDVNLAARLMSAGKPGQILLSPEIHDVIQPDFQTTALNPIRVKGKSKSIPIFQVDGLVENSLINRLRSTRPLIGRETPFSQARAALDSASKGVGQFVLLDGPAGIGKTHLAGAVLQKALQTGARVLAVQCRSYTEEVAYAAFSVMLRSAAGVTSLDTPQIALDKFDHLIAPLRSPSNPSFAQDRALLGALMGIAPSAQPQAGFLSSGEPTAHLAPQPPEPTDYLSELKDGVKTRRRSRLTFIDQLSQSKVSETGQTWEPVVELLEGSVRQHTYDCVVRLLRVLSSSQSLVLFFDDAHWMDKGSTDLLGAIKEKLTGLPVLVLMAGRNWSSDLLLNATLIQLPPLQETETTLLVADVLVSEIGPLIYEQTGGNPLFVREIARWIQHMRRIAAADLENVLRKSEVLHKLILSRVEKLPEISLQIIRAAAMVGTDFRISLLQAALGKTMDEVTLSNHLRILVDASLLQPIEGGVDARYAFQQEMVRNVIYNSQSFEHRREMHARIADSLVSGKTSRRQLSARIANFLGAPDLRKDERHEALIAYHLEGAGRSLPAAQSYLKAAGLARQRKDWQDAHAFYKQALDRLNDIDPSSEELSLIAAAKCDAIMGVADMLMVLEGDAEGAIALLESAIALLEEYTSTDQRIAITLRMAILLPAQHRAFEGLTNLAKIFGMIPEHVRPLAGALVAWLNRRTGKPVQTPTIESAQQMAASQPAFRPLLAESESDWVTASDAYRGLGRWGDAAMVHVRWGDDLLRDGDALDADNHYQAAACLWRKQGRDQAGLALAALRHAEAAWQRGQQANTRRALSHAVRHLENAPAPVRQEGRIYIKKANKLLDMHSMAPWPAWNWHYLDDRQKITLFYQQLI